MVTSSNARTARRTASWRWRWRWRWRGDIKRSAKLAGVVLLLGHGKLDQRVADRVGHEGYIMKAIMKRPSIPVSTLAH